MNLKVKTLHELMTMALWLADILVNCSTDLLPEHFNALKTLQWETNAEITLRLIGTEDPIKPKRR